MLARDQFKIILSLCEMLFPLLLYSFYYCMMSGGWKRYSVFFNHFISHKNNCCCGFLNTKYCFPAFAKNSLSLCFQTYCLSRALRARSRIQKHLNFVRLHTHHRSGRAGSGLDPWVVHAGTWVLPLVFVSILFLWVQIKCDWGP